MYSLLSNDSAVDDNNAANDSVFVLSLGRSDLMHVSPRNAVLESLIHAAIDDEWSRGLKSSGAKLDGKVFQFKLKGTPFLSLVGNPDIKFSKVMLKMLHNFHQAGYVAQSPLDISLNAFEADAVVLRRVERQCDVTTTMFGMLPFRTDRLLLINAPAAVSELVQKTIGTNWRRGIQGAEQIDDGVFKIQIGGRIWLSDGEAYAVMARLHNVLLQHGFERYASVRIERCNGPAMMVFQKVDVKKSVKGK
jgi:hypothetical protein